MHVVPNAVDHERYDRPKGEGAEHRLVMVGWAQKVKDPVWALRVLAGLRARDPRWSLRLVGDDFPATQVPSAVEYAAAFRRELAHPAVAGGVEFVPYTDDVPGRLADAGYVLSTSVRESFHLGLVEGAAAGAVPVVRDWPLFARTGGARGLFPPEWVVGTVAEAVERVAGVEASGQWAARSDQARQQVRDRFSAAGLSRAVRTAVLGTEDG